MKTAKFDISSFWSRLYGWFHVRMPIDNTAVWNDDVPEWNVVTMWDVPEIVYELTLVDSFSEHQTNITRLGGTVPLDVDCADKMKIVRATAFCFTLVGCDMNSRWNAHATLLVGKRWMEFPPQNVFDAAFATLVSAALNGVRDIAAHSRLATKLLPREAYIPSNLAYFSSGSAASWKATARNNGGYRGPFWDEVVDELSGAKQSDRGDR